MSRVSLDEHQDALLTDAEREALGEDAPPEMKGATATAPAAEGPGDGERDDSDDEDDNDDDEGAATDSAGDAPAAAAATAAQADDEDDAEAEAQHYEAKLPAGFDDLVRQNKDAMAALRRRRDEGEIGNSEFDAEQDRLLDEREDLRRQQMLHEVSKDMRAQAVERARAAAEAELKATAKAQGLDYGADPKLIQQFNLFFNALADEHPGKSQRWLFAEAHKRVAILRGVSTPTDDKPAAQEAAKKPAKASRAPDLSNLPKTLADVPGGTGAGDVDGDEFANLDDLDGMDLEDALAARLKRDPNFDKKYTAAVKGNAARRSVRAH